MSSRYARIFESDSRRFGELTKREMQVYICLQTHRNIRTGRCDPSRRAICEGTGLENPHVSIAIKGLEAKGWITDSRTGFEFVTELVTGNYQIGNKDDAEKLPNRKQKVTNLARKVTKSVKPHNIVKQTKQSIEHESIDTLLLALAEQFPEKDRRLIELGILQTFLTRHATGITERISSINYFLPEIEKLSRETPGPWCQDTVLQRRREQFKKIILAV